ncbi:M23 family metallopeptidase [Lysobacter tyrosinilyticus]
MKPDVRRLCWTVPVLLAAFACTAGMMLSSRPALAATPRPDFLLPYPCNVSASLTTYQGHNPDDKKIDFYSNDTRVVASADGYVHEQFNPGGIEIAHGNGWFTTYMHMTNRIAVGTWVKRGQVVGTMSNVGTGAVHLHYEQLYNPDSSVDADNQHITFPVLQGVAIQFNSNYTYTPSSMVSTNCGVASPPPSNKYWVDTFANAPGYGSPTSTTQTGTLYAGTNYVYCKAWGRNISNGTSFNHWWLKTDLDVGPANQWVSAYYLSRWGNDEAKDNNGIVIPTCPDAPPPSVTKYWVDTFANAPGYGSPTSTTQTGTLNAGTSYVFCKSWGRNISNGTNFNHWWLKTDLDVGPANQWVSAYYLSRWGNDEAKDNNGVVIPDC